MGTLKEKLQEFEKQIKGITKEDDILEKFKALAIDLINNFHIVCGEKKYCFAEIEFYYYDKDNFNQEWNEKTYPRTEKEAGQLFFHYSGVDVCFDSKFDDGKFGGILIRSLKDEKGKFITGPSVCSLEILNACSDSKHNKWPEIIPIPNEGLSSSMKCEASEFPEKRYGITYKDGKEDKRLCFYDKELYEKYNNGDNSKEVFENARWNYEKNNDGEVKGQTNLIRYYHRFNKKTEKGKNK